MVASPLPDREHRHLLQFYVAPKMDYGKRLLWAALLIVLGLAVQLLVPIRWLPGLLAISLPWLLLGTLLLLVRGFNLRPTQSLRRGSWEKTTRDRFAKMRELEHDVKRWDESFTDYTCVTGLVSLAILVAAVALIWLVMSRSAVLQFWAPVFVADAIILLLPHWVTGTRRGWRPVALRQIIDALEVALSAIDRFESPPCQIQPMFEMAGKRERQVPVNARAFVRFPDGPADFLGMQLQVALNNVQGTNYPYLYAVLVARKGFGLLDENLDAIRRQALGATSDKQARLTIESSREDDVEVIVIRQHTTKKSGYHTKPAAIRQIALTAWQSAELVLQSHTVRPTA